MNGPPQTLRFHTSLLVDNRGAWLRDPTDGSVVGTHSPSSGVRMLTALAMDQSGLTRRYYPHLPSYREFVLPGFPGETEESCIFAYDFSYLIPRGVGVTGGELAICTNTVPIRDAHDDWTIGPLQVHDRTVYATLSGGVDGTDYQLIWAAFDTEGNVWRRVGLILCSASS